MREIFKGTDHEKSVEAIKEASISYGEINSNIRVYNPEIHEVEEIEMFDSETKTIEFFTIKSKSFNLYLRAVNAITFWVYYEDSDGEMVKYEITNTIANLHMKLKKEDADKNTEISVYLIAFLHNTLPVPGRILSANEQKVYISNRPVQDSDMEIYTTSLEYFLYIGFPLIIITLLVGIIILTVCLLKKRKQYKNAKEKNKQISNAKGNNVNSERTVSNPTQQIAMNPGFIETDNVQLNGNQNNIINQENPLTNPGAIPQNAQIIYGAPPQGANMPYPVMYVMPNTDMSKMSFPQTMTSGSNNFETSRTTGNTRPSGTSNFPIISNMPNIQSNLPNHYANSDPLAGNNDLKVFDADMPREDTVPMFEIDVDKVNNYQPGQKFQ